MDLSSNPKVLAGLTLDLKPEYYPFWSRDNLEAVSSVKLFAKTGKDVTIYKYKQDNGEGDTDTLTNTIGELRWGSLENTKPRSLENTKPQSPTGPFTFYFNDNSMEELWLALTWEKNKAG